jgi:hypothetical protein
VSVKDVLSYSSVGSNAYNEEEVVWFEATYEYLEGLLDDTERAKRMLPARKQRLCGRAATSAAAAAPAAPSPPEAAALRTTPRAAAKGGGTEDNSKGSWMRQKAMMSLFSQHLVPGSEVA